MSPATVSTCTVSTSTAPVVVEKGIEDNQAPDRLSRRRTALVECLDRCEQIAAGNHPPPGGGSGVVFALGS